MLLKTLPTGSSAASAVGMGSRPMSMTSVSSQLTARFPFPLCFMVSFQLSFLL